MKVLQFISSVKPTMFVQYESFLFLLNVLATSELTMFKRRCVDKRFHTNCCPFLILGMSILVWRLSGRPSPRNKRGDFQSSKKGRIWLVSMNADYSPYIIHIHNLDLQCCQWYQILSFSFKFMFWWSNIFIWDFL